VIRATLKSKFYNDCCSINLITSC